MALQGSTKVIFNALLPSPWSRDEAISFYNSEDSKGGHSVNSTSVSDVIDEGRTEDNAFLQLKIKNPKLIPAATKQKLTADEEKQLYKEFGLAESLLNNFKDMLREQGLDPSRCSVSISTTYRITYRIPPEHSKSFGEFIVNKITLPKQLKEIPEAETPKRRGMKL